MPNDEHTKSGKKAYQKPQLRTIELVADEVLAVGCKVQNGVAGFDNPKASCALPRNCFSEGS